MLVMNLLIGLDGIDVRHLVSLGVISLGGFLSYLGILRLIVSLLIPFGRIVLVHLVL